MRCLVHAGQPALPLLDDGRLEGTLPIAWHVDLDWADLGHHGLRAGAVTGVAAVLARRVVLVIAEMVGDLALQGGLQNRLGQLLQQPSLASQLQPLAPGLLDELVDELPLDRRTLRRRFRLVIGGHRLVTVSVT
jgi:hypothetical protein